MKFKRFIAFIIDMIIVSFISSCIFTLPIFNDYNTSYTTYINEYTNTLLNGGSSDITKDELNDYQYEFNKVSSPLLIIKLATTFIYFCIFAYINKGSTLGQKIFKLKVAKEDNQELTTLLFVIRGVLKTNLLFDTISLFCFFLLSKESYLSINSTISNISLVVIFFIVGLMIFRSDERGGHDLLCKTKVISTK